MATVTIDGTVYTYDQAIIGSDVLADTLTGADNHVRYYIDGLNQNDLLTGAGNNDILVGGFGSDTLVGGPGDDVLIGDYLNPQGVIISDSGAQDTFFAASVSPPGLNADWKAWENYQNHLIAFFNNLDPALTYRLNGVEMTAQQLSNAWDNYLDHLSLQTVHVISGQHVENVNGHDTAIHDLTDNLALFASLSGSSDQTDSAAFLDFGSVQVIGGGDNHHNSGIDTAVYSGPSSNYTVVVGPDSMTVHDNVVDDGTDDGTDTLFGIERLHFTDQTIDTTNFTATAALPHAQLVELVDLYVAYFNRAPDALGLDFWGGALSHGASFATISAGFAASPEAAAAYPATLSTADFVTAVYTNVLGRNTDNAGFNFWVNTLQTGAVTRGNFVLNVIESVLGETGTPDAQYIANRYAVGAHFALTQGLSDGNWARTVMNGVDATATSVTNANHATDAYAAIAANPATHEFVVHLVGVAV